MNCRSIPEREDWFLTDRKPTICPRCGKKEVKKSVFGMPSAEDYYEAKYNYNHVDTLGSLYYSLSIYTYLLPNLIVP